MDNREVGHNDLKRLQMTLESLAADLDAIERRPHLLLRLTAETTEGGSRGIEGFVDPSPSSWREPGPIQTVEKDRLRAVLLFVLLAPRLSRGKTGFDVFGIMLYPSCRARADGEEMRK